MRRLAFVVGLLIAAAGVLVILLPAALLQFAEHSTTWLKLIGFAALRVSIGLLLLAVAPATRLPRTVRVLGVFAIVAGVLTPAVGVNGARLVADWWSHQPLGLVRALGLLPLALGGLVVYACAPAPRAT